MLHLDFIKAEIDENIVYDALTLGSLASETDTAFANVKKAVHGSVTRFLDDGEIKTGRFYIPGARKTKKRDYDEEYYDEAAKLLRDAVRIRCEAVSGAKIGCEFSGGLDSGMVTALIDELADIRGDEKPVVFTWSPAPWDYKIRQSDDGMLRDEREVITRFCEEKGNPCIFRNAQKATDRERILSRGSREEICEYETGIIADSMEALADAEADAENEHTDFGGNAHGGDAFIAVGLRHNVEHRCGNGVEPLTGKAGQAYQDNIPGDVRVKAEISG
jgi:hypothetical protein